MSEDNKEHPVRVRLEKKFLKEKVWTPRHH